MKKLDYKTDFSISKDGTKIGYRQLGSGPGLILLHGGLMGAQNLMQLAQELSDTFTVYLPDRRGRGLSADHKNHNLVLESEDIQSVIQKTNTENIFGLSAGAIVTLQTALTTPSLKKIALFEPPIPEREAKIPKWYLNYECAISKGNFGKAMMHILKGTGDPSFLTVLPVFITAPVINRGMKSQRKDLIAGDIPLEVLTSAFKYDYRIVTDSAGITDQSKNLQAELLLLGGSKSRRFLKDALDQLSIIFPKATRIEFPGLGHIAAANDESPEVVAAELKKFFGAH